MNRLSKFTLSLAMQCLLLVLALFLLDSGHAAILLAALCTAWNLVLALDWVVCRLCSLHRQAIMQSLPAWILCGLPVLFFGIALSVRWEL